MYMYMRRLVHMHAQGKDLREDIYTAGEEGMMRDKPRRRDMKRMREERG